MTAEEFKEDLILIIIAMVVNKNNGTYLRATHFLLLVDL